MLSHHPTRIVNVAPAAVTTNGRTQVRACTTVLRRACCSYTTAVVLVTLLLSQSVTYKTQRVACKEQRVGAILTVLCVADV